MRIRRHMTYSGNICPLNVAHDDVCQVLVYLERLPHKSGKSYSASVCHCVCACAVCMKVHLERYGYRQSKLCLVSLDECTGGESALAWLENTCHTENICGSGIWKALEAC